MTVEAGELIREARLNARMTQAELARRAGVSQPVISAYEGGHRQPGLGTLRKLIEAAGHELRIGVSPRAAAVRALPDTAVGRRLRRHRKAVMSTAAEQGVSNIRVFGSVARGEETGSSDIDLLVDVAPGVGLVSLIRLERELSTLLGAPVDVVPESGLKHGVRDEALAEAIPL